MRISADLQGKYKSLAELKGIARALKEQNKTLVFANGCFDIVHVGHIRYLREAAAYGDALLVAVNSDASVRRIKGPGRPVFNERERTEVIAALACVDYVTLFDEPTVTPLLLALTPDFHAKGTDYSEDTVPERDTVAAYGGRVIITGDKKSRSSTELIHHVKQRP